MPRGPEMSLLSGSDCECVYLPKPLEASQGFFSLSFSLLINLPRWCWLRLHGEMSQFVFTNWVDWKNIFLRRGEPRSSPQVSIYQRSCKKRNCFSFLCFVFETFFFCFVDKLFFLIAIQIAVFGLLLAPLRRLICRENLSKLFSFLSSSFLAIRLGISDKLIYSRHSVVAWWGR